MWSHMSWRICGIGLMRQNFGSFLSCWLPATMEQRLGWIATKLLFTMNGWAWTFEKFGPRRYILGFAQHLRNPQGINAAGFQAEPWGRIRVKEESLFRQNSGYRCDAKALATQTASNYISNSVGCAANIAEPPKPSRFLPKTSRVCII
jgi:hypothetical protein